jgi:hypothetical protein
MSISPAASATGACQASSAPFTAPANTDPVSGTAQTIQCDLTTPGCKPNANVAVDGNSASVRCSVTGGGPFNVSGVITADNVGFSVNGPALTTTGGKASITSQYQTHNLQGQDCDITIEPNKGQITPGAVWASFSCPSYGDRTTGDFNCAATGKFIFENCAK